MRRLCLYIPLLVLVLLAPAALYAQAPAWSAVVPRVIRLTGTFVPASGLTPSPVETVTLAIFADETGGAPLWQETQYVTVDAGGHYTVLLGASQPEGLPQDVFASGEARWLGRKFERAGEHDQARVLLASVPYALKASDADTLGGRPAAAYLLADVAASPSVTSDATASATVTNTQSLTAGTANYIGKFINGTDLAESSLYDTGLSVGLGTVYPRDIFHVSFTNTGGTMTGYAVQNLGNTATSYSGMLFYDQNGALGQFQGFNNVTHEYRINNIASSGSINFMLGSASKFQVRSDGDVNISGALRKGGARFLNSFGTNNTFLGLNAGNVTTTGTDNTADGFNALPSNAAGSFNTASGSGALYSNTGGSRNTANGFSALRSNTTGSDNTANGVDALHDNAVGNYNTASGSGALALNTDGNRNTASGFTALRNNTTGGDNTANGVDALHDNTVGSYNTASGAGALYSNTFGTQNTASGRTALASNTIGADNTASGALALYLNTEGNGNTGSGLSALHDNTTGSYNTGSGVNALVHNTTGAHNTALGTNAGESATTGDYNIYLGADVAGVAGESNTMYLGKVGQQTRTFVAGVRGVTTGVANSIPVLIDSNGQLGTISSSRRFKEDIHDMGDASRALFALRPVTFRYSQAYTDGAKPIQYGLVAEEVAETFPDLAVRSTEGRVDTVHYETLSVLLLNEVQKQQTEIETQRVELQEYRNRIEALERHLNAILTTQER